MKLKNRNELIWGIAFGLKTLGHIKVEQLRVIFWVGHTKFEFSLPAALDCIAYDHVCDNRGDWSNADQASVEPL